MKKESHKDEARQRQRYGERHRRHREKDRSSKSSKIDSRKKKRKRRKEDETMHSFCLLHCSLFYSQSLAYDGNEVVDVNHGQKVFSVADTAHGGRLAQPGLLQKQTNEQTDRQSEKGT